MGRDVQLFTRSSLAGFTALNTKQKCLVINAFWPHLNLGEEDYIAENYTAFFEYISKTLQVLSPHEDKFAAQELGSLLSIICTLRAMSTSTRDEIIGNVKKRYLNTQDDNIARSVELSLRFWLGINVNSKGLSVGPRVSRDSRIEWQDEDSVSQMVSSQFRTGEVKSVSCEFLLESSLTAVNLKNICRLHIRWTNNLADHLKLEGQRGKRSLSIYRHKICLVNHRKEPDLTVIPAEILDEAIRSLDLLFPFGDAKTEEFLASENVQLHNADPFDLTPASELNDFKFWRRNMAQLLNLLNGPPETLAQTLLDTRNLSQFATLWVAIFGVFFLTILFGILSTVYAIKQYRIALKSYQLSLAMACVQMPSSLPEFCK